MSSPSLSVVIVPLARGNHVERLLRELAGDADTEVLVVDGAEIPRGATATRVEPASGASVPERRAVGAAHAGGELLAFLEDTVQVAPAWATSARRLFAQDAALQAAAGPLQLSPSLSPRAAALALLDYGRSLTRCPDPAEPGRPASALPGNAFVIRRRTLEELGALEDGALREAELIPRLVAGDPDSVRREPALSATCVAVDPRGARGHSRFQHGRLYAGHRHPGRWGARLLRAAGSPLLPPVMLLRAFTALRLVRPARSALVLLHAAWMAVAWATGEAVGYLFGAGSAEREWR